MDVFNNYEVVAGVFLSVYFFVRGVLSFKARKNGNGNGDGIHGKITLADISREHQDQASKAATDSLLSRQEYEALMTQLREIKAMLNQWDDLIHEGQFSPTWTQREVASTLERLDRIEQMLKDLC